MPPVGFGYTFADFLQRLERSPVSHMSPLYHEHRLLFVNRPDMLSKAMLSVSWERGLAILQAAYYTQPVAAETYRALLARMLRHNRHVTKVGAGQLVSWQAAISVMNEAVLAHGTSLPTRVSVSTLRLLAPHRRWQTALDILKLNQTNGQLTKPMLLDAARACATEAGWSHALMLLMHLHKQEPLRLSGAIQSMRPPGTTALTSLHTAQALLPAVRDTMSPSPAQHHILEVLNDVVASVPPAEALQHPLCRSYLTHLLASTTLPPELKVQRATAAMAQLPWTASLQLLTDLSEPTLLTDEEWQKVQKSVLLPTSRGESGASRGGGARSKKKKKATESLRREAALLVEEAASVEEAALSIGSVSRSDVDVAESNAELAGHANSIIAELAPATSAALFSRLQLLHASPATSAAMIAVMVEKLPTPEMAVAFIRSCAAELAHVEEAVSLPNDSDDDVRFPSPALPLTLPGTAGSVAPTRHPVVTHALLHNCVAHQSGWSLAARVLLEQSGARVPTPADVLSTLIRELRRAKEVLLVVRLLHEHVVPSGSVLTAEAWEDVLECALAHNRVLQLRSESAPSAASDDAGRSAGAVQGRRPSVDSNAARQADTWGSRVTQRTAAPLLSGVHWVSALSWVLDRQAATKEARIRKTGTGVSHGATARRPTEHVSLETPLTPKMLSLLINICVQGNSPQGALQAMGYARRVSKMELPHTAEIRALLYCLQYNRPFEAEAIVAQLTKKEGEKAAQPLQHLLRLIGESKPGNNDGE